TRRPCCAVCCLVSVHRHCPHRGLHSFPTRRSSDLGKGGRADEKLRSLRRSEAPRCALRPAAHRHRRSRRRSGAAASPSPRAAMRSEEHTSELQSPCNLVCRLLLEKKNEKSQRGTHY